MTMLPERFRNLALVRQRRGLAVLSMLACLSVLPSGGAQAQAQSPSQSPRDEPARAPLVTGLPDFTPLVERNHQAVVNISTRRSTAMPRDERTGDDSEPSLQDELIRRYRDQQRPRPRLDPSAQGSGFIISDDGYVLTNNHVVAGADEVLVRLYDRRQFIAEVIGTDPRSDMAVLKIDGERLPVVTIGDSEALPVGAWVLAIGSPFGFDFSVTAGIVSAKGRALPNESYVPFIQTDVAINPGNSGGPLFNLQGDVIGINSQIYSRTGSFSGLSFAIPIELAMDVAEQIRTSGTVRRGWLGVIIQEVTMDLAETFGMRTAHGALVANILDDSPAAASDLLAGDIITHFEGRRIGRSSSLPPLVGRVPVNTDAAVRVVREGRTLELSVNIGELPGAQGSRADASPRTRGASDPLALSVRPVDRDTRQRLGIDKGGVLVTEIEADGPAERAGIVAGDVILTIDNTSIDSPREFRALTGRLLDRESVPVLVQRESGPVWLALKLEQ